MNSRFLSKCAEKVAHSKTTTSNGAGPAARPGRKGSSSPGRAIRNRAQRTPAACLGIRHRCMGIRHRQASLFRAAEPKPCSLQPSIMKPTAHRQVLPEARLQCTAQCTSMLVRVPKRDRTQTLAGAGVVHPRDSLQGNRQITSPPSGQHAEANQFSWSPYGGGQYPFAVAFASHSS